MNAVHSSWACIGERGSEQLIVTWYGLDCGCCCRSTSLQTVSWVWACTTKLCLPETPARGQRSGKGLCPCLLLPPSSSVPVPDRGIPWLHWDKDLEKQRGRDVLRCWMLTFLQKCLRMVMLKSLESAQLYRVIKQGETFGSVVSLRDQASHRFLTLR